MNVSRLLLATAALPLLGAASFSSAPRPTQPRKEVVAGFPAELPRRGVVFINGGLVADTFTLSIDLDGRLHVWEHQAPNSFSKDKEWSRPTKPAEVAEVVALADAAWRGQREFPRNPAAEYAESLLFLDGDSAFALRAPGGFPSDSPAGRLAERLKALRVREP